MEDPEDVIQMYLMKLTEPKRMEGIMDALEIGMTVKNIVEGVLRVGVANGIHTVDVSLLTAPVLHDYIVGVADELGIDYDEGFEDKEAEKKAVENKTYLKTKVRLEKAMQKNKGAKAQKSTVEAYEAAGPMEDAPMEEAPVAAPTEALEAIPMMAKGGLVQRRTK
jgi:hypothetical protein